MLENSGKPATIFDMKCVCQLHEYSFETDITICRMYNKMIHRYFAMRHNESTFALLINARVSGQLSSHREFHYGNKEQNTR